MHERRKDVLGTPRATLRVVQQFDRAAAPSVAKELPRNRLRTREARRRLGFWLPVYQCNQHERPVYYHYRRRVLLEWRKREAATVASQRAPGAPGGPWGP